MDIVIASSKRLTNLRAQFTSVAFSPDGERIAFACITRRRCAIGIMNRDGSDLRRIAGLNNALDDSYWDLQFTPDGSHLLCILSEKDDEIGTLCLINVVTREQNRLTNMADRRKVMRPCLSPDGRYVVFEAWQRGGAELFRLTLETGGMIRLTNTLPERAPDSSYEYCPGNIFPCYSPDGDFIAFASSVYDGKLDQPLQLCLMRADGSDVTRLTQEASKIHQITWHPDGKRIAFTAHVDLEDIQGRKLWKYRLSPYLIDRDGSNLRRLECSNSVNFNLSFRPGDGRYLVYSSSCEERFSEGKRNWDIRLLDVETGEVIAVTDDDVYDTDPLFSPDGNTLFFVSERAEESTEPGQSRGDLYSVELITD